MRDLALPAAALLLSLAAAAPAGAAAQMQPPMNTFNDAFYSCDDGGAFQISYNSKKPTTAKITTSNNNKNYALKRTKTDTGVAFEGDGAKFTTDGVTVTVTGTETSLQNCKMQG